jgi:hypothetical protein
MTAISESMKWCDDGTARIGAPAAAARRPALSKSRLTFISSIVNQITFTPSRPGQQSAYRVAQADFNIRAGQGRMGVIFRRRPCFFTRPIAPKAADISQTLAGW